MAIYFNVKEMTKSQTAKLYHIDNTPTEKVIENLKKVMYILDIVTHRETYTCQQWIQMQKTKRNGRRSPRINAYQGTSCRFSNRKERGYQHNV